MSRFYIEWKWAFIFSATSLAWALIAKMLHFDNEAIQYAQVFNTCILAPTLIIYILCTVEKRNKYYHGQISFKQAMISGIMLSLGVTVLGVFTTIIATRMISPDLFINSIRYYTEQKIMTPSEATRQFNLSTYIITGVIAGPLMGIVLSLVAAVVVPKTKKGMLKKPKSVSYAR